MRYWIVALCLCLTLTGALAETDPFLPEGAPIVQTETAYHSQDIAIEITAMRYENSDVYVADVHVRQVENIQRVYAGGAWKTTTAKVADLAQESGAILAITGDSGQNIASGLCIGNGVVWRDTRNRKRDVGLLYKDGSFQTLLAPVDQETLSAQANSLWQSFLFGPVLLDENGKAMEEFNSTVLPNNPRSAIGYYAPGHYCLVQVDGRSTKSKLESGKKNRGVDMESLSLLMESLGCTAAYNLDGGRSSMMWFGGELISTPDKGGRRIGDIVAIKELDT